MLEFLQTGKALSVLAVIAFIGAVSKLITRSLYRRLLKDTENMAMTRNKNLKILKQKLENTYRVNQNIVNSKAYLDKLMYDFRFLRVSFDAWDNVSRQMVLLGLFAGGTGSFLSYWYRIDSYYIVLYASMGALAGLFLMFLDSSFHIGQKKQKLETILLEYVDNSVFVRAARENSSRETMPREAAAAAFSTGMSSRERYQNMADRDRSEDRDQKQGKSRLFGKERELYTTEEREQMIRENEIKDGLVREESARRAQVRPLKSRNSKAEELLRTVRSMKQDGETEQDDERAGIERTGGERIGSERSGTERSACSPARRDIESLRKSLEQIAASRDRTKEDMSQRGDSPGGRDWMKNISEEEMRLISEIMRQYFSGNGA